MVNFPNMIEIFDGRRVMRPGLGRNAGPQDGPDDEADRRHAAITHYKEELAEDHEWIDDNVADEFLAERGPEMLRALDDLCGIVERLLEGRQRAGDPTRTAEIFRARRDWATKRDACIEDEAVRRADLREEL